MNLSKLCGKDTPKYCAYCEFSNESIDKSFEICKHFGKVEKTHCCRKYKYNPLKRIPPKRVRIKEISDLGDL